MSGHRDPDVYLGDILDAASKAIEFAEGLSFDQFKDDDRTSYAVLRALELVGEAAKQVPQPVRDQAPEVPWQDMAGMRDKLIHSYRGVDLQVVWRTVQEDLPPLVERMRQLRAGLDRAADEAADGAGRQAEQ